MGDSLWDDRDMLWDQFSQMMHTISNKESIKKMSEDVECNIQIEKEYQLTEENIKTQEAESSTTSETEKLQVKEDDPPKQDKDGMDCEETSLEDPVKYTEKDFCTDSENSGS